MLGVSQASAGRTTGAVRRARNPWGFKDDGGQLIYVLWQCVGNWGRREPPGGDGNGSTADQNTYWLSVCQVGRVDMFRVRLITDHDYHASTPRYHHHLPEYFGGSFRDSYSSRVPVMSA